MDHDEVNISLYILLFCYGMLGLMEVVFKASIGRRGVEKEYLYL